MTVNIKDVVITMNDAQKRSFKDDRQNLINLAKAVQDAEVVKKSATQAFNEALKETHESFKEFGVDKDMLKVYSTLKASGSDIEPTVSEFESKVEMLQFLDEDV